MKKLIYSIGALGLLALVSCGPGTKDALAYNDKIMDIVNIATLAQNNFFDQTDGHNMDSLKLTQSHYSEASKKCVEDINKMDGFADKKDYLNAAIKFVKTLDVMADNEAKQMVDIMTKDTSEVTDADISKVEELITKLDEETKKVSQEVVDAQQAFSKEWKFEIGKEH
ncbi:MAG: hypothetical protein K0S53_1058 [Bacteroidetes bacterium]|jgi:hypothetical protein|nr:hypothetical protein [Bacteroidota bacterium]